MNLESIVTRDRLSFCVIVDGPYVLVVIFFNEAAHFLKK